MISEEKPFCHDINIFVVQVFTSFSLVFMTVAVKE